MLTVTEMKIIQKTLFIIALLSFSLKIFSQSDDSAFVQDFNETKSYKIKNDISKDPNVSIFDIILVAI